jgi:alkaline phosphatase
MQYHLLNDKSVEPTLMEMTRKALQLVSKNENGYVLLIESGKIDHSHHETKPKLAFEEVVHFQEVVEYVRNHVDIEETLILVTADHSHTLTISGYPTSKFDFSLCTF